MDRKRSYRSRKRKYHGNRHSISKESRKEPEVLETGNNNNNSQPETELQQQTQTLIIE